MENPSDSCNGASNGSPVSWYNDSVTRMATLQATFYNTVGWDCHRHGQDCMMIAPITQAWNDDVCTDTNSYGLCEISKLSIILV